MSEKEQIYQGEMKEIVELIKKFGKTDVVIGLPILSEQAAHEDLVTLVKSGIGTFYSDLKTLIICVHSYANPKEVNICEEMLMRQNCLEFGFKSEELQKRGWAIRSIMEAASMLGADMVILEPALFHPNEAQNIEGMTPDWLRLLYQPVIDNEADYSLPRFSTTLHGNSLDDQFLFPLLGTLYNIELRSSLAAGFVANNYLVQEFLDEIKDWIPDVYEYGIDAYLLSSALAMDGRIAEVYIGVKPKVMLAVGLDYLVKQSANAVFHSLCKNQKKWLGKPAAIKTTLLYGRRQAPYQRDFSFEHNTYLKKFQKGFTRYYESLWLRIFTDDIISQLKEASVDPEDGFLFSDNLWTRIVYNSLIAYNFSNQAQKEDIINSMVPLFNGRLAGVFGDLARHCELGTAASFQEEICPAVARRIVESLLDTFLLGKQKFAEAWATNKEKAMPYLPQLAYWEYIPGAPILLPLVITRADGTTEYVSKIYEELLKESKQSFEKFIVSRLSIDVESSAVVIGEEMHRFMVRFESFLDTYLLPGDIHSVEGIRQFVAAIFNLIDIKQGFVIKQDFAEKMLREYPPRNLITILGFEDIDDILKSYSPLEVMALSVWSEESKHISRNHNWMLENMRAGDFEYSPIRPLIVDQHDFPEFSGMKDAPTLNHLTGIIVVSNIRQGAGGEFPKTRLFTTVLKRIIDAEEFGSIWCKYSASHRDFANMVLNSIEGHWGVSAFSARSIFENLQQLKLRNTLKEIHQKVTAAQSPFAQNGDDILKKAIDGYMLGMTMPDGQFVTASIWSWSSFSFKGGKGIPTPLSLMVERRYFSSELFFRCHEKLGGNREEIYTQIIELMGEGKESDDLAIEYLGAPMDGERIIIRQHIEKAQPVAGALHRSLFNPILVPIKEHYWESKYVLNCGIIRLQDKVYILYRAYGDDNISRIGYAVSSDGIHIDERLADPVFVPEAQYEKAGCEDPRLILLDDRVYMLYTAYDGVLPQIALASITPEDLIEKRFDKWERHGLVFPGSNNKDAIIFPERINGRIAMYHRINPSIWMTYSEKIDPPWPRKEHNIIMGTRSGMMWDAVKIGAGAPPIKTKYGWLHIYHGVDYGFCYRLGIFITDLDSPGKLTYRSPNPILEPKASYEIGVSGKDWVPNVVFTCGAVPKEDKYMLDDDDEILVYYGCADSNIGVAFAKVSELIPEAFRKKSTV